MPLGIQRTDLYTNSCPSGNVFATLPKLEMYGFDPAAFPDYEHTMTHQPGSALDNHDQFGTWVFTLQ